jgi:hypothetical protein
MNDRDKLWSNLLKNHHKIVVGWVYYRFDIL